MKSMNSNMSQFDSYREDNRREVKKAKGGLPVSLWETYSAFANCYGGVIILGVKENKDGSWYMTGLENAFKLRKDFWDTINNKNKVSANLLTDSAVEIYEENGNVIMVIHVPKAKREQKPVYINGDMFSGTFRRNWEGDYHCDRNEVLAMLRDQPEETADMKVLQDMSLEVLNSDTVHAYRNRHMAYRTEHVWERLSDEAYIPRGIVIRKDAESIVMENPGSIRTGKSQMLKGGISDPRNKALMKMLNLIGIGERAGSGVPDIYSVWAQQGWKQPEVIEEYGPDRTVLKLLFAKNTDKKALIKSADKKEPTNKTRQQLEKIIECMEPDREYRIGEMAEFLGVKETRARELIRELIRLDKIEATGKNKGRRYRKTI